LLSNGEQPKAMFSLGMFTSNLADSLKIVDHYGVITDIDMEDGYCYWTSDKDIQMPCVSLNVITLLK
jgi:hypothetical protein